MKKVHFVLLSALTLSGAKSFSVSVQDIKDSLKHKSMLNRFGDSPLLGPARLSIRDLVLKDLMAANSKIKILKAQLNELNSLVKEFNDPISPMLESALLQQCGVSSVSACDAKQHELADKIAQLREDRNHVGRLGVEFAQERIEKLPSDQVQTIAKWNDFITQVHTMIPSPGAPLDVNPRPEVVTAHRLLSDQSLPILEESRVHEVGEMHSLEDSAIKVPVEEMHPLDVPKVLSSEEQALLGLSGALNVLANASIHQQHVTVAAAEDTHRRERRPMRRRR